jgi:hypothetical protein
MPALVYLHGFASSPGGHKGQYTRRWAEAHGVAFHAPDLNLPSFEALTVTAQVEAVGALVRTLQEPPVLVGSSLGGFIAMAVAQRERPLRALILVAPALGFARRRLSSPTLAEYRERGEMEVFHFGTGKPLRLGPDLLHDLPNWLGDDSWRIPCPTVILHGRHDEAVPLAESEAFAERNPGVILRVLDDDHGLLAPPSLASLRSALEAAFTGSVAS